MKLFYLLTATCYLLTACASTKSTPYNESDFQNGGPDAPYLNERTVRLLQPDNMYYDTETHRPRTKQEKTEMNDKWETSRMETRWQEYKGAMIRVQILLGSLELREMRLKLIQNANGMDIDGDAQTTLGTVANFEMKRVCGRNAESFVLVYDSPSFEVLRPTPYFDYVAMNEGVTMREYGFRCVYK